MGSNADPPIQAPRTLTGRTTAAALTLAVTLTTAFSLPAAAGDFIRRSARVQADDAHLWLLVRGDDRSAPVFLWLHGGPGGAETPFFRLYNRKLERSFVVAYWDQRGAGRSFEADADPSKLTVGRHLRDLDIVVDRLRTDLGVDTVALVGHSWGSALGMLYARRHPGKVSAFVGVGPLVNEQERQRSQLDFALSEARKAGDERAMEQIAAIGPPPFTVEQELAAQSWVERYGGLFHDGPSRLGAVIGVTLRGYARPWEIPRFIRGNNVSLHAMMEELADLDLTRSVPAVKVPVLFVLGRHDRQVDARIAASYFERLQAPAKRLVWFEHSAHNVPFEEPERFNAVVRAFLLEMANPDRGHADRVIGSGRRSTP